MRVARYLRAAAMAAALGAMSAGAISGCASEDSTEPQTGETGVIETETTSSAVPARKTTALAYHDLWRRLWEDHITWTRVVIIGVFNDLPGTNEYVGRLLKNYDDMQSALAPYYGREAAAAFGELLKEHLTIAADVLIAAKAGDSERLTLLLADWRVNADALASQMHELNPEHWDLGEARSMWHDHLDVTLAEATLHLSGDFSGEILAWEQVHSGGLMMADFMSRGVVAQFRKRFIASGKLVCGGA